MMGGGLPTDSYRPDSYRPDSYRPEPPRPEPDAGNRTRHFTGQSGSLSRYGDPVVKDRLLARAQPGIGIVESHTQAVLAGGQVKG
jgi:hypothetical protein